MSKKAFLRLCCFIVLMVGLSLLAAAQTTLKPAAETVTIPAGSRIEIAAATCNSWPTVQDLYDAIQLAMDDYGLIKGFDLQRNDHDTFCDQSSGASAAADIVANPQNTGVVGPIYSTSTFGAAPVFEGAGIVMISPSNTNTGLPALGPHVFNRTLPPDPEADPWLAVLETLPSVATWRAHFEATYGRQPETFAVLAYDATTLLLTRIDEVSEIVGTDLVVERAALAAVVRNTAAWPGASGPLSLSVDGNRVNEHTTTVWADQFEAPTLDAAWDWLAEDPTHWSLTANPGFMRLTTRAENSNRLVRAAPWGDFEIRTHLLFAPDQNYQIAGLYVYGDEDNYATLGRAYCDAAEPTCVGNGIYFDVVEGGAWAGGNCAMTTAVQDETYLRIVRQGANLDGYVSTDGTTWQLVCSHAVGFAPTMVGLRASNQEQAAAEIPADLNFFVLQAPAPHRAYLPLVRRATNEAAFKVGMVTDVSGIDDKGFNQHTWAGLQRAETELGVDAQYIEGGFEADYETNIAAFAEQDYDLIITVGFLLADATAKMAEVYPDVNMAIIDNAYDPPIPNVAGVVFDVDEAAFPAGYLAAAWAVLQDPEDPQIGYVAGMQIPPVEQFIVAYEAGANYYNEQKGTDVQVKGVYVGDFEAPDDGKIQGNSLIDEGVDVIFGCGGKTGNGGIAAAKERGKWGVGVDVDQYFTLPNEQDILITSVMKRLDNAVFAVVESALNGEFPGGGVYVGTLENGGVGLAPYHDFEAQIPVGLDAEIQAIMADIIAGTIDTGW